LPLPPLLESILAKRKSDLITPVEMLRALQDEVLTVTRAAELRLREITELVTAYTKGEITPQEANERFILHSRRWRDPIFGGLIVPPGGITDEEIHRSIDEYADVGAFSKRIVEERGGGENKGPRAR
jgi:hypothetical protein